LGPTRWNSGPGQVETDRARARVRSGIGERVPRHISTDSIAAGSPPPRCGPGFAPLSLLPPINGVIGRRFSPSPFIFPLRGETSLATHHRLATNWPHHFCFPSAWLILVSLRSFCPRFHDHRSTPPPTITDHSSDTHPLPMRALPITSHRRQAPPSCF
jgi:hypothetical protein